MNIIRNYPIPIQDRAEYTDDDLKKDLTEISEGVVQRLAMDYPSIFKAIVKVHEEYIINHKPRIKSPADRMQFYIDVLKHLPKNDRESLTFNNFCKIISDESIEIRKAKKTFETAEFVMELGSQEKLELLIIFHTILQKDKFYTPWRLFKDKLPPLGLREKTPYYKARDELIKDGWLLETKINKKRSTWAVNTKMIEKRGVYLDKIIEQRLALENNKNS